MSSQGLFQLRAVTCGITQLHIPPIMLWTNYQKLVDMSVTGVEASFPFVSLLVFQHEWQIVLRGKDVLNGI